MIIGTSNWHIWSIDSTKMFFAFISFRKTITDLQTTENLFYITREAKLNELYNVFFS